VSVVSSHSDSLENATRAYTVAIAECIQASFPGDTALPDTIFIGKHDQFPGILLPEKIQGVNILLLTNEEYEQKTKYRPNSVFINMIDTPDGNRREFTMVVFHDWAKPQYNFHVILAYIPEREEFVKDSSYFDYVYERK
jgi:hypothetical protein